MNQKNKRKLSSKLFFMATACVALSMGPVAHSADVAAAPSSEGNKIVLRFAASGGYASPTEINGLIQDTNAMLAANGYSNVVMSDLHLTLLADLYGGYQLSPDMDVGVAFAGSPIISKTVNGTDFGGNAASLKDTAALYTLMARGHYNFASAGGFKFYGSPSIGVGHFMIGTEITSNLSNLDLHTTAKGLVMRAAVGASYPITSSLSVTGEGGYLYAKSGALNVDTASANSMQTVGSTLKTSAGADAHSNLSGPFISLGVSAQL